jgi:hypothetical protein
MSRPRVADGGDGLQIWRVAVNISNKQSRTANKGWSSSLGVGRGAKQLVSLLRNVTQGLGGVLVNRAQQPRKQRHLFRFP